MRPSQPANLAYPAWLSKQPLEKSVVSQGHVLTFHTSSTAIVDLAAVADVSGLLMTMPSLIHPTRLGMLYAAFAALGSRCRTSAKMSPLAALNGSHRPRPQ